jgi:hypothetical protein
VRAGGDAETHEAAVARGFDVVGRVADQAGGARVGTESFERVFGELALGFEPGRVERAEDAVE